MIATIEISLTLLSMTLVIGAALLARKHASEPTWPASLIIRVFRLVTLGLLPLMIALLLFSSQTNGPLSAVFSGMGYACMVLCLLTAGFWEWARHIDKKEKDSV